MSIRELTDVQNACLEAAQEALAAARLPGSRRSGVVSADDVVEYVWQLLARDEIATIARPISKAQASRALQRLCAWGILRREPRYSAGWGQGWWPSCYSLISDYQINQIKEQ